MKSDLARQLGAERLENRHIMTDARSKMTSVPFLWAAGDVGVHAEQVTIAMGEGAQAAIWMNKVLLMLKKKRTPVKLSFALKELLLWSLRSLVRKRW